MHILIIGSGSAKARATYEPLFPEDEIQFCRPAELAGRIGWAEVLLPLIAPITAEIMDAAEQLRLIQQVGVGLEKIDLTAAAKRRLPVCNVPGHAAPANAQSTAELALLLTLALSRRLRQAVNFFQPDSKVRRPVGRALLGRPALIVGFGNLGRALTRLYQACGMTVSAVKRTPDPALAEEYGLAALAGPDRLLDLAGRAEVIANAVIATPETRNLFDETFFRAVRPGTLFISVSRGEVVDEKALEAALKDGRLAGAGLDVFAKEPVDPDHPLLRMDNVVATPHLGGLTEQATDQMLAQVKANIDRLRRGEPVRHQANEF